MNPTAIVRHPSLVNSRRKAEAQLLITPFFLVSSPVLSNRTPGMNQIISSSWGGSSLLGRQSWTQIRAHNVLGTVSEKSEKSFLKK